MKTVEVVAAIIFYEGKVLCMQRGESKLPYISKKYEFPGGKIEKDETREEGLKREISEELDYAIEIEKPYLTVDHTYPDFRIIMHSYLCKANSNAFTLTEHIDYRWLDVNELLQLDWAAADVPIVEKLMAEIV